MVGGLASVGPEISLMLGSPQNGSVKQWDAFCADFLALSLPREPFFSLPKILHFSGLGFLFLSSLSFQNTMFVLLVFFINPFSNNSFVLFILFYLYFLLPFPFLMFVSFLETRFSDIPSPNPNYFHFWLSGFSVVDVLIIFVFFICVCVCVFFCVCCFAFRL